MEEIQELFPEPEFVEAAGVLEVIKKTPEQMSTYISRMKYEMDEEWRRDASRQEGFDEGKAKGFDEGIAKGNCLAELNRFRMSWVLLNQRERRCWATMPHV